MHRLKRHFLERLGALRRQNGQTLVEYALIILLVGVALVLALQMFGSGVDGLYQTAMAAFA